MELVLCLSGRFTKPRATKAFEWEATMGGLWLHLLLRAGHWLLLTRLLCPGVHQDYMEWLLPNFPLASSNVLSALSQILEIRKGKCISLYNESPLARLPSILEKIWERCPTMQCGWATSVASRFLSALLVTPAMLCTALPLAGLCPTWQPCTELALTHWSAFSCASWSDCAQ